MKAGFFRILITLVVSIMVTGSLTTFALDSGDREPPARPEKPEGSRALHRPSLADSVPNRSFHSSLIPGQSFTDRSSEMASPDIALGQPGFNFSIDKQFGVTAEPYPHNTTHLNGPGGLFIDAGNNVYVAESEGSRVLRFDPFGTNTLEVGSSGWYDVSDGFFNWPQDVHVDNTGDIWVVDASRVTRYSSSRVHEMSYPANEDERNDCASDSLHFCYPQGLAFDSLGRLYVADTENHRIQVFTISGGNLVYLKTIGTGTPGTGSNQFYYPSKLATNAANELFVADSENHRVQKCTYGVNWTCSTFHGVSGVPGSGANDLWSPRGIAVDSSGNVYIADEGNWRVKKCTSGGSCSDFAYPDDPTDVAVDSSGNVFVSTWYNSYTVEKYDSFGNYLGDFAGTSGLAYVHDSAYIYSPHGIGVDPAGNIYVSERRGNRWLKIDPSGGRVWTKGTPGMRINNSQYFGENLYGNPAISAGNLLFLPAGSQRCVKVYDLNGVYQNQVLGTCHGATGDTGTLLGNVAGVAISPLNGNIYVVDRGNRKVKIYNSGLAYLDFLGQGLGAVGLGNGNYQFDEPMGIAIDSTGSIYVADRMNHRVMKYNSGGVYQYMLGVTDFCDWPYGYLCSPSGVAVDSQNRLYVAENWNNRVTIYDATGAYLSTIGGDWGQDLGRLNGPAGVAVAPNGTLYVTEQYNHRVQVFKPGVVGWVQSNLNGFGNPNRGYIWALETFNGYLYATPDRVGNLAELWRFSDATGWNQVVGFGTIGMWIIADLVENDGYLYAATYSETGAGIWRSSNGTNWSNVYAGNVNIDDYSGFWNLSVFNKTIYAASDYSDSHATRIIKSSTGNIGSWTSAAADGFGVPNNHAVIASQVYNGCLYMGTWNDYGGQLWRTCNGTSWSQVDNISFGDSANTWVNALDAFNNKLYVSTSYNSDSIGNQLFSCSLCDGSDWTHNIDDGMGNPYNNGRSNLISSGSWMYWSIWNWNEEGMGVWKTNDGLNWQQIGDNGLGDVNNFGPAGDNSGAIFNGSFYLGTRNWANGGEIWKLQNLVFLPFLIR